MGSKPRASRRPFGTFISSAPESMRADLVALDRLIRKNAPALAPAFAEGMMGYGRFHYRYASGREGYAVKIGLRASSRGFSLHCLAADARGYLAERYASKLAPADVGKSCVRFRRLADLDESVLAELIEKTARTGWA